MNSTPEPTIQQLFDLSGKTVLISGASGYLGSAMARGLAEAGARLVISSRNAERAQQAASELPDPQQVGNLESNWTIWTKRLSNGALSRPVRQPVRLTYW